MPALTSRLPLVLVTRTLRLTTFGGFALSADEGALGAAAGQRRPMAVLALLAAAGEVGISRERIIALLWPDAEPERGRRTLTQTLYSLRRATGAEELFLGVTDLRLNPAVVASDIADFDAALRAGRLAEAAELYRGPFIDGFTVPGADEFERWTDVERQRLAQRCADALRELARRAGEDGDLAAEIGWRRRTVALDPLDSPATLALVTALGRAGDVAGAQRAARIHEALVREELGLPLAPAIEARLAALIAEQAARPMPAAAVPVQPPVARPELDARRGGDAQGDESPVPAVPADQVDDPPPAAPAPVAAVDEAPRGVAARPPLGRRVGRALAGVAAVATLVAAAVAVDRSRARPAAPAEVAAPVSAGVVAILPFTLETTDPTLAFLHEGAADLMARMLTGDVGPRATDPGAVLDALDSVRTSGTPPGAAVARMEARAVARRVGAAEVLLGRISGGAARVTLSAVLLDVATGAERATADVSGPIDSLSSLVDGLTVRLLTRRALSDDRAAAFAGATLPALRAYLRAEAAFRADRLQEAVGLYEQALLPDSTFAPAALGLAIAADRLNVAEQHDRGLALAWAARARLGARDRAYLLALAGPRFPAPTPAVEQLAAWEGVVSMTPDRADAWSELGERFFYDGRLLGIRNPEARAAAAFRRALELDPDDPSARRHRIELAARANDRATLDALASAEQLRTLGGELTGYLEWRVALARRDTAALAAIRGRIALVGAPSLRAMAMASQHDAVGLADGARALRFLSARAALASEQLDVLLAQHSLALNRGRPVLALDITEQLEDAQPGSRAHLRLRVLDALYSDGDTAAAADAARELAAADGAAQPAGERARTIRLSNSCVLAQWRAAPWRAGRGGGASADASLARRAAAELRAAAPAREPVPVGAAPHACAQIVEAMLAVGSGAADARERVQQLDALMLTGPAVGDASAWGTLAVARLFELLGDRPRALAAVRQRPYMKGWPRYLATALRTEARLAQGLGDAAGAASAYERALALRADPEAALRAGVAADRAALRRLRP